MMILQKSRGINNFLEISDVQVPLNYEAGMLTGNSFRFIPPTEIREMDSMRTLYVKIDGMCTFVARFARVKPSVEDVKKLCRDICGCLGELGEYLLDPGGLVIDSRYVLYNSEFDEYFLYFRQE